MFVLALLWAVGQEQAALLATQLVELLWACSGSMLELGCAPQPPNQGTDREFILSPDKLCN